VEEYEDSLAQAMVDMAAQSMTLAQIAGRVGMDEASVHRRMTAYLENQATSMSVVQMRMLQLRRMEHIIGALWEQVMAGDLMTQGRNVKNMIDVIREITELMDLKKDRLRDEQVRLTQAQTQMVLAAVDAVRTGMLVRVLAVVGDQHRDALEAMWHGAVAEYAASAVESNSNAVIKVGDGAGPVEPKMIEGPKKTEEPPEEEEDSGGWGMTV
jgi:hypothetical protein